MAIIFQDDFDRANENLGDGPNWTDPSAVDYSIVSNEVRAGGTFGNTRRIVYADGLAARADMNIQCDMKFGAAPGAASDIGLIGRRTGDTTYYLFRPAHGAISADISKVISGVETLIAQATPDPLSATYKTFRFEVFGTSLKAYQDGSLIINTTDSSITAAGFAGLYFQFDNVFEFWENFFVGDTAGSFVPLNFDSIIPLLVKGLLEVNNIIQIEWTMCKIFENAYFGEFRYGESSWGGFTNCVINLDQLIPLLVRIRVQLDSIIPVQWGEPPRVIVDHIIVLLIRRAEAFDQTTPISWSVLEQWVKQAVSESDAFIKQVASESDAWVKQTGSVADAWIKHGGSA